MYIYTCMGEQNSTTDTMHRTQLFLSKDLYQFLLERSREEGITLSELVRQVMTEYFHRQHRKDTEAGIQTLLRMGEELVNS